MSQSINKKKNKEYALPTQKFHSIDKPIFIGGLGRSGTTIVHSMLSKHPKSNWLSLLASQYPGNPKYNRWLMSGIDIPFIRSLLLWRFRPLESYSFWNRYFGGFCLPCRDLTASDTTEYTTRKLRAAVSELLTKKRNRLIVKTTGFPRISFLHKIFPNAKFVHILRDGRAVANSRMKARFWDGWRGPDMWCGGPLPPFYENEWNRFDRSFVALAGIEWKLHLDQFEKVKSDFPKIDIFSVRYEDFCKNPLSETKRIAEFCELEWSESLSRTIKNQYISSENSKWKLDFTEEQKEILEQVLRPYLVKYGYEKA